MYKFCFFQFQGFESVTELSNSKWKAIYEHEEEYEWKTRMLSEGFDSIFVSLR